MGDPVGGILVCPPIVFRLVIFRLDTIGGSDDAGQSQPHPALQKEN